MIHELKEAMKEVELSLTLPGNTLVEATPFPQVTSIKEVQTKWLFPLVRLKRLSFKKVEAKRLFPIVRVEKRAVKKLRRKPQ